MNSHACTTMMRQTIPENVLTAAAKLILPVSFGARFFDLFDY
jgi:hypothetical protein